MTVPVTGDWQAKTDVTAMGISLSAGLRRPARAAPTRTGCADSQWLWCNGYFDFGNPGSAGKMAMNAEQAATPAEFALKANFPNPFNPSTRIEYALAEATHVRLDVFDLIGRRVATLIDASQPEGRHQVRFEADELPSGVYLYRIQAGAQDGG